MNNSQDNSLIQFALDNIESFAQNMKKILMVTFVVTIGCVILVQWVLDPEYDAHAVVIPSAQSNSNQLSQAMGALGSDMIGDLMGFSMADVDDKDLFLSIYSSKSFAEKVISKHKLREFYKMKEDAFFMDVLKEYRRNSAFSISDEDAIELLFRSTDPQLALSAVEYTLHLLDSTYNAIKQNGIRKKLSYINARLVTVDSIEKVSHQELANFQKVHGIYDVDEQLAASIESISKLEMQKSVLEIEKSFEFKNHGKESFKYKQLVKQIREYRAKIHSIQKVSDPNSILVAPAGDAILIIEFNRLLRESKVNSGIYQLLRQQAEQLELDLQTNLAHLNIVDPPWVADKKSKPSKRGIVSVGFAVSLLLTHFVWFMIFLYRRESDEHPYKAQILRIFNQ